MPVTEEQLIALMKEKGITDEQIAQGRAMRTARSFQSKQQPSGVGDLINKFTPNLKDSLGKVASTWQQLAGVNPQANESDDYSKLYAQEAIKKQFESPIDAELKQERLKSLKAGITTDEQGNIVRTSDVARDQKEGRMRDFQSQRMAGQLRGELNQNSYVKRFQEMNSAATGIDAILSDTISRADNKSKNIGDQALITLYNKILDPMSVVRESEYARTPEGMALMNRLQGFVQKVQAGGSGLTDADRVEIARAAKVLINNAGELYNQKLTDYEGLATGYESDPKLVTGGYQRFSPYDLDKQYGGESDPIVRTGTDNTTKKRVGMTKSGKVVELAKAPEPMTIKNSVAAGTYA